MTSDPSFVFPQKLATMTSALVAQKSALHRVACFYADTLQAGGCVHVYANGHSRLAVEEMCVRMGALSGFHPLLQSGLTTFTDVVGPNGLRLNQAIEKFEGLGEEILKEFEVGPGEPLIAISATGQTQAAVDIALAWVRRYPENPLIVFASRVQASQGKPKHSSGKTLWHVAHEARCGIFLDNGMPMGDVSVTVESGTGNYHVCPLSSLGAIALVQSLNELTIRELDRRGVRHPVLQNMHLHDSRPGYDEWLHDQRRRYAGAMSRREFSTSSSPHATQS